MTALPDLKFFTTVPYSKEWKAEFKDFFQTLPDANDALYHLTRFSNHLNDITNEEERTSKGHQIVNRLHELKKKIYIQKYSIPPEQDIDKVGCVVLRKNNDALFTTVKDDDGDVKFGFPKGQFEYKLTNPSDIYTVYGEGYANGALRELKEETGFSFTGKINIRENIYTGVLERSKNKQTDLLPILGGTYHLQGDRFYLILYVKSHKDLKFHEIPDNEEGITSVVWQKQYTSDSTRKYNSFSKVRFEFPEDDFFEIQNNNYNNLISLSPTTYKKTTRKQKQKTLKKGKRPDETPKKRTKSKYSKTRSLAH
jgi:hypothetical protein